MILEVESREGPSGEVEPEYFFRGASRIAVVRILDRWPAADRTYFKLLADDANTYILRHDAHLEQWELTQFLAANQDANQDANQES